MKLIPCPKCGGEFVRISTERGAHWVGCEKCGRFTSYFDTTELAIDAWNDGISWVYKSKQEEPSKMLNCQCGDIPQIWWGGMDINSAYSVSCRKCGRHAEPKSTAKAAITAWNRLIEKGEIK